MVVVAVPLTVGRKTPRAPCSTASARRIACAARAASGLRSVAMRTASSKVTDCPTGAGAGIGGIWAGDGSGAAWTGAGASLGRSLGRPRRHEHDDDGGVQRRGRSRAYACASPASGTATSVS